MSCVTILRIPIQSTNNCVYIKQGDTIPEISFVISDTTLDLSTANIKMQLYYGGRKVFDISNGSGITINSSTEFVIDQVEAIDNNLPKGVLIGDLEITDVNGVRFTYMNVEYTITEQFTR